MARLQIHRTLSTTLAEGPGLRYVLWVQGCSIRCKNCAVPWTWDPDQGESREVNDLADEILAVPEIEGVTFLGGEPFDQASSLAELAGRVRKAGLSILTFTGRTLEELLIANRSDWNALLDVTDLLIDGPFVEADLSTKRPWVGSSNQRFHFLTQRYVSWRDRLEETPNRVEIRLLPDGRIELNGMASPEIWNKLVNLLRDESIRN